MRFLTVINCKNKDNNSGTSDQVKAAASQYKSELFSFATKVNQYRVYTYINDRFKLKIQTWNAWLNNNISYYIER